MGPPTDRDLDFADLKSGEMGQRPATTGTLHNIKHYWTSLNPAANHASQKSVHLLHSHIKRPRIYQLLLGSIRAGTGPVFESLCKSRS